MRILLDEVDDKEKLNRELTEALKEQTEALPKKPRTQEALDGAIRQVTEGLARLGFAIGRQARHRASLEEPEGSLRTLPKAQRARAPALADAIHRSQGENNALGPRFSRVAGLPRCTIAMWAWEGG